MLLLYLQLYSTTEPVFEIVDLYYSLAFRRASYARFFAFHKLKTHIETLTPLERFEDPEFRTAYDTRFRTVYDQLESDYFQADMIPALQDPAKQLAQYAVKIKTEKEKEFQEGVRLGHATTSKDGSIVIERQRLKTGIPKTVTLSKELSNIFGRLKGKATEFFKKRKDDLASSYKSFFNAEDGHTIYHSDIKSIWYNFFPKKGKGGREARSLFGAWATMKDLSVKLKKPGKGNNWVKGITYYDVVSIFGLTHRKTD